MYTYGLEADFWWRLLLLIAIFSLLLFAFGTVARKWWKVKRGKILTNTYVNERHKEIDWFLRSLSIFSILAGFAINSTRPPLEWYWFLQPWFIGLFFLFIGEIVRAFMQYKYAENHNAYKVTISNTVFAIILYVTLATTNFWGLM